MTYRFDAARLAIQEEEAWVRLAVLAGIPARLDAWREEVERRWEQMQRRYREDPGVRLPRGKVEAIDSVYTDVTHGRL